MKRILCFLTPLFLAVTISYGQEFLTSPDYIYGCASDLNESKADSMAILSLAKCIDLSVETSSEYSLTESKKNTIEQQNHRVSVSSNVNIQGAKKHVEYKNGLFTVYYYFNRKQYIAECLTSYNENCRKACTYKDSKEAHAKNFVLGHYYLAYEAVSSNMFKSLYSPGKYLEAQVLDEIAFNYSHLGYLLSARNVGISNPSGVQLIRDENCKILPGFEYLDNEGGWSVPITFLDHDCNDCDYTKASWAYIYTYSHDFRFLFEIKTEFGIQNLHVPDEFYEAHFENKHFFY